jgi:hypothetical protein
VSKRSVLRRIAATIVVVLVLVLVPSALAANSGNGHGGKPGGGSSSASLILSPNPVASWSPFWGTGCGYTVGRQVNIVVNSPYWNAGLPVGVDGNGCIRFQFWVDGPGTYGVKAMQSLSGNKQMVLASASLTVT